MMRLIRDRYRAHPLRTGWRRFSNRWTHRPKLEITHHRVVLRGLPAAFDGLRVAHLSDIHHSLYISLRTVERAVEATNELRPDLVALTGDFVTFSPDYIAPVARALGKLRARLGIFAVLGNHDFRAGAEQVARELRRHGVEVLRNSHTAVAADGQKLWLIGVDDIWYGCDLAGAARGLPASGAKILLCHNPAIITRAARYGFDLVLSGHTHGGQVRLPVLGSFYKATRFANGWDRLRNTQIYVTRGLGKVVVPFRIGCPPEIALLELRAP